MGEGVDFVEHIRPATGSARRVCEAEHHDVVRCVARSLLGTGGAYSACARDFAAIRCAPLSEDEHVTRVLEKGWATAWKHFRLPLEQLAVTAKAVGTCKGGDFRDHETRNEARFRQQWSPA